MLEADDFERLSRRVSRAAGRRGQPPRFPESNGRVKTSAAWLIERAGFSRGHGDPETVAISSKHTLALTNRGAGTTAELVRLAREIADGVAGEFGVELGRSPCSWATNGSHRQLRATGSCCTADGEPE